MSSSSFGFRAIISVSSNELGSVPFFSIFLEESIVSWMLLKSFLPPRTLWGLKKFHTLSLDFVVFSSIGKTSVFKVRRPRIGTHFHFTCYMTLNKLFKSWDNHFLFILFFLFLFFDYGHMSEPGKPEVPMWAQPKCRSMNTWMVMILSHKTFGMSYYAAADNW